MDKLSYSGKNEKFCLELDRVRLLLKKAGNPDEKFRIIHIAGTNGKGSVCSFVECGLIHAGVRCGRFSSPELFCVEDTISVNGKSIRKKELASIADSLMPLAEEVATELGKSPSPFEILFVSSLVYFAKRKCTFVILECGMGGLGDATNCIRGAEIAVFTKIDTDHTAYLGETIAEITLNKCGILRDGITVFSAVQKMEAERIIVGECRRRKCNLGFVPPFEIKSMDSLNAVVDMGKESVCLSLAGLHQSGNAALAANILWYLGIKEESIKHSLVSAKNRARLEKVADGVYFDGAHNPAGVKALVESINSAHVKGKMIFAIGFMADKDISACLEELKSLDNQNFEIYTANVKTNPRSETATNLALLAGEKGFAAQEFDTISQAVKAARTKQASVFAFGSLYMYKELFYKNGEFR